MTGAEGRASLSVPGAARHREVKASKEHGSGAIVLSCLGGSVVSSGLLA